MHFIEYWYYKFAQFIIPVDVLQAKVMIYVVFSSLMAINSSQIQPGDHLVKHHVFTLYGLQILIWGLVYYLYYHFDIL